MDEIFDKIRNGASKAKSSAEKLAKKVAKSTSNAITHTKLAYASNEANSKVKDIYAEIGKTLYAKYLDGKVEDEEFAPSFDQLDKLMEEIEMISAKIAELKNSIKCPECGAFSPSDSAFCSKCGSALEIETDEDDEDDIESAFEEADIDDEEDVIIINPKKPEED